MRQVHPVALIGKLKEPMNYTEPNGTGYFRCKFLASLQAQVNIIRKKL